MTSQGSDLTCLRVLVVDDEYMVALHIETLLEDYGCEVIGPVATIDEALALVRTERLDGVLLDANLNGESSSPIALELQASATPFIVVTGYGRLELASDVLNCAPRLVKPFTTDAFLKVLKSTFLLPQDD